MAIYHCNISNVSRAKGSTSCATLSYISGKAVKDERLDKTFEYGRKQRVEVTETIIPETAPREYQNPSFLFNAIEKYEKTANARTAKKIELALPRELTIEQQQKIVEQFIKTNLTEKGYACSYAIHTDKANNNPHAHILVANRTIDEKGQWSSKRKSVFANSKNEKGECIYNPNIPTDIEHRIPCIDENTGLQKVRIREGKGEEKLWARVSVEVNHLDRKETLQELREQWAIECNKYLAFAQQIDHRSYAEQGKDKAPTIHEGYGARAMERRGELSDRCEKNRKIRAEEKTIATEQDENRAFIEVLKETESRLQDLKDIGTGAEEERTYNFAYDTVICTIEQEKRVPILICQGESVAIAAEDKPTKALNLLQATKEKWNSFIEECRESYRKAYTNDLSVSEGESTPKQEKPSKSLIERFKGYFENRAKEKAERKEQEQEQARKRAEERRQKEEQRKVITAKMGEPVSRFDYKGRLAQLDYVAEVWRANRGVGGDTELCEEAFKKLGEIAGVRTRQYDPQLNFHVKRYSKEVPQAEVETAIQKTKDSLHAQIQTEQIQESISERFKQLQEQNRDKIAEMLKERQSRTKDKTKDKER